MPASHHRWFRGVIAISLIVLLAVITGCASHGHGRVKVPDQSRLDPATQALDEAVSAHADTLAPRMVGSARQRITIARDILYEAGREDRELTVKEQDRIQALVDEAKLDAQAALVNAQAKASSHQLRQLQDSGGDETQDMDEPSQPGMPPGAGGPGGGPGSMMGEMQ